MKMFLAFLLVIIASGYAGTRTGISGENEPALQRGTYTVEASYAVGLSSSYGLAIQDDLSNSIWISNYSSLLNNEFDMSSGSAGSTWSISSGVDPDDQGYCEYPVSPNQFFFGDWSSSFIAIYDASTTGTAAYFNSNILGPGSWTCVCGVAAGHNNIYASDFFADEIGWGTYTGTESTVTWTTAAFSTVSGMAVYGDYLFVCTQVSGTDNIFIFKLDDNGVPDMTPEWSCNFTEYADGPNGGIDYDGEFLWVYPQNDNLYKLDIDWTPEALVRDTWAAIKSSF